MIVLHLCGDVFQSFFSIVMSTLQNSRVRLILFVCIPLAFARPGHSNLSLVLCSVYAHHCYLPCASFICYAAPCSFVVADYFGKLREVMKFVHCEAFPVADHVSKWSSTCTKTIRHVSANSNSFTYEVENT